LPGDTQFFVARHRRTGGLLAITQGGVKNDQLIGHYITPFDLKKMKIQT
jgi:hypothetical protein